MALNYTRDTTSGDEGLDLPQRIHTGDESLPVVVMMTAWGSVNMAVEAMRRGARDFVQKPWENERLLSIVRTQTELGRAIRRGRQLEAANQALQLLINLLRNAADACLEVGGPAVTTGWRRTRAGLEIVVEDEGPGLSNTANLFVPFFTTKPGGSLTLENRKDTRGCRARLTLPIEA